ncbi:MAG: SLC13 family permease [Phycisphaerae bacterium]
MKKISGFQVSIVGAATLAAGWLLLSEPFILPDGLDPQMPQSAPQRCVAIFLVCMALWLTNMIPLAATGLFAIAALPLLGVMPEKKAFGLFGNTAVFFMLGVFLLAAAMIVTGLSKRVTLLALQRFDKSPGRLVTGVMVSSAFLALWMPEHAVAAMIYPILVEIVETLRLERGHAYAKKLFLALAWGSIIGGVGTFLGGARAPLALSLLADHSGERIGFLAWMLAAMPVVLVMVVIAHQMLLRRMENGIEDIRAATNMLDRRVRRLGPMSWGERKLAVLGSLTVLAWIIAGHDVNPAVIAMIAAVMIFVMRIVDWKSVQDYVNWGVLIMYGGAVALGSALKETQAIDWLARQVISAETSAIVILILLVATAILLTEGISNSAAVAILLPIGFSLGDRTGVSAIMVTMAVTIPAGLAFLLPVSSPPNAISFSAGHYSIREVVRLGWPMTLSAFFVVILVIVVWWQGILGVNQW